MTDDLARLARVLNLEIPDRYDAAMAVELDIKRLLDTEKRWVEACALARTHCPVGDGESHVRQGIPRLAAEVQRLRADLEIAESRKSDVIQRLSAFARECRDNWDCDTDAHTHGTLCRVCEAGRVLIWGGAKPSVERHGQTNIVRALTETDKIIP